MQDYRNEVKEIFSGDEQLAAETEFALKIAEKERATVEEVDNDSLAGDGKKAQVRAQCSFKPLWTHWFRESPCILLFDLCVIIFTVKRLAVHANVINCR